MTATTTLELELARTPHALARVLTVCAACWVEVAALHYADGRATLRLAGGATHLERAAARLGRLVDVLEHECASLP